MKNEFDPQQNTASEAAQRLRRSLCFAKERQEDIQQVLRSEYKYLLSLDRSVALEQKLRACVSADRHNGAGGYDVRSLYFDTPADRDYQDKMDGVDTRRKLRLRIYSPGDDFAFLEMKQKQNALQRKRSLRITKPDALRLARGEYGVLLGYNTAFAEECYAVMSMGVYRPKTIVQFRRSAYFSRENDTRVTFDRDLRATQSSFDLFSERLCLYPVLDPCAVILEVKYNNFLLYHIKQLLQTVDSTAVAQSKYCLACAGTL